MRNIVSIIKFDIKSKKIQLIIEFAVILFFIIRRLILGGRVPSDVTFIPVISVVLIINFIISIGKFLKSISIEEGRLLFLTPIKGWELICAKYLEFIGLGLLLILFTSIGNMIIGGDSKLIIITSLSILLGVFILFILITSLIVIFKSYISNTGTCVILTIISMWIIAILIVLCWSIIMVLTFTACVRFEVRGKANTTKLSSEEIEINKSVVFEGENKIDIDVGCGVVKLSGYEGDEVIVSGITNLAEEDIILTKGNNTIKIKDNSDDLIDLFGNNDYILELEIIIVI